MIVDRNPRNPRAFFGGNDPRPWLPPGGRHQQSRQPRRGMPPRLGRSLRVIAPLIRGAMTRNHGDVHAVAPDAGTLHRTARVMRIGPRPDAMKPDIHCVGTPWIRSFMAFQVGP